MKNEILYNKTVQILVDAYMNDTLIHSNCHACAVGNIVAASKCAKIELIGTSRIAIWNNGAPAWQKVFMTVGWFGDKDQEFFIHEYNGEAKRQIDSTGYSWSNLAKIEYAFETAEMGDFDDEWMLNGLLAVIDALDIIHENTDEIATVSTKKRFAKV